MKADRTVHAECSGFEVVRYDRSGKWYIEPRGERPRQHADVMEAAVRALAAETLGGTIHDGLPGGAVFDRQVAKSRAFTEWVLSS